MRMSNECQHLTTRYQLGNTFCSRCGVWLHAGKNDDAGSRPSAPAPSDDRVEFPSGGPCSACGDGDTEQKYHKHVAPDPSGKPYPKPTDAEVEMPRAWIKARGRYLYDAQNWEELGKNYVWNVSYLLAGYHKALTESFPVDLKDAARQRFQVIAQGDLSYVVEYDGELLDEFSNLPDAEGYV